MESDISTKDEETFIKSKGYDIQKILNKSDYFRVYLAKKDNELLALKILKNDNTKYKKIYNDIKSMSNIKMRNIVEIKDVISEKGYLVIVMEYCSNLNLVNYINKHKNDSNEEKIKFIWKTIIFTVFGLDELHDNGIIHKDIRPENIFITEDLYPKIGTPDLAEETIKNERDLHFSIQGYIMSFKSFKYLSKELYIGDNFSMKSDIWALGCVFYYLATGREIYDTDNKNIISSGLYNEKPLENIDPDIRYIIKYLLTLDEDKRPFTDDIMEDPIFNKYIKKYDFYEELSLLRKNSKPEDIINISNYAYPEPINNKGERICILSTGDIHGHAFPIKSKNEKTGEEYDIGGLVYISKYLEIFRKEWKDKLIYLDAGDIFSGGLESKISNGNIMIDYFNYSKPNAITFGNHEFDKGWKFLDDFINKINSPFISANIYKKDTNELYTKNGTMIINAGKVKIGIIAVTTCDTPNCSLTDFSNIIFKDCKDVIIEEANKLRPKVNAIILFAHIGMACISPPFKQDVIGLYDINSGTRSQEKGELKLLLDSLPSNTVDAVVAGHLHQNYHYFYNGIPVVLPKDNGLYMNAMYLTFDENGNLLKDSTIIEGAIPVTNKTYFSSNQSIKNARKEILNYISFHGVKIEKDSKLEAILKPYEDMLNEYNELVLTIDQPTYVHKENSETVFGNIICDIVREYTNADFAILSNGNFRATWNPPNVNKGQIMEMFPFPNNVSSFNMTGKELYDLMNTLINGRKYQISGFRYTFKREVNNNNQFLKIISIINEKDNKKIELDKEYLIGSLNYFVPKFGDDFCKIKDWYKPKNLKIYELIFDVAYKGLKQLGNINYEKYREKVPNRIILE